MNPDTILTREASELSKRIRTDVVLFAEKLLGLPVTKHKGQLVWLQNSKKTINILRPGNKWGKSFIAAVKHIWHAACKPLLPEGLTDEEWMNAKYETLNFGPGYEQAREVLKMVRDIVQGSIIIPEELRDLYGNTNKSFFKDWFITNDRADATVLPSIEFATGAVLFGRSYDEMGKAFKMKALAFCTGDECADIAELWTFTSGTLLPRMVTVRNPQIDYYGTPQPEGYDYQRMIEMAEEDMKRPDWKENGMYYTQRGSMYDNAFLPKATIKQIESIADPVLRRQIIEGEFVETGEKYFGFERIQHAVDPNLKMVDEAQPGRRYLVSADFAGGTSVWADYTVILVLDYTEEPYKVVYMNRFKGGDISIPAQYQLVDEICQRFGHPAQCRLILDSTALGGKNAFQFLQHLHPISADFGPNRKGTMKSEMLANLKIAFDGGQSSKFRRIREKNINDEWVDKNMDWGLIRIPDLPVLINELQNYKLDDDKLRTDCVFALAMPIHWVEMRRPKKQPQKAVDLDFLSIDYS